MLRKILILILLSTPLAACTVPPALIPAWQCTRGTADEPVCGPVTSTTSTLPDELELNDAWTGVGIGCVDQADLVCEREPQF